jgi:hypothetical protein
MDSQLPASCHMDHSWVGDYLDAHSAARHHVIVRVGKISLELVTTTGFTRSWPYNAMIQTQGSYKGEAVRFEYRSEPVESVVIVDHSVLAEIRHIAAHLPVHFHDPSTRRARAKWTAVAALPQRGLDRNPILCRSLRPARCSDISYDPPRAVFTGILARIIHERFYCNRGFAAATSCTRFLRCAGGRACRSVLQHTVSSMLRISTRKTLPPHRLGGVHKRGAHYSSRRGPRDATTRFRNDPS